VAARAHNYDDTDATLDDFWSSDAPMQACLERARMAARTDLPILILGESGTGKTILARAIHNSSARRDRPFVAFNAAALSETLLDSQLFGHERGAFTGAQHSIKGKFELADGGTLFVDEVGDLSPTAQSKILRAVETGEFERLGSEALRRADVRLISATHHRLADPAARSGFRDDLFYRISGIMLFVPSLRERPNDLPMLLAGEIERASRRRNTSIVGLDREAADLLLSYAWPGNLRELSKVVQAAVALTSGEVIGIEQLPLSSDAAPAAAPRTSAPPDRTLRHAVHRHIKTVLEAVGGNKRRAARELGVSRATLERKLQEIAKAGRRAASPK
jgi:two-component system response regulator HydG